MQTTQNISKSLAQVLATYCEKNNIRKDTDVLEAMLTDYAKTLELPKADEPKLNPRPDDTDDTDRSDLAKWVGSLKNEV
jgi:hypothetical protein